MLSNREKIQFVIPVFNEEHCIPSLVERLLSLRNQMKFNFNVDFIFVNDGSKDQTLSLLKTFSEQYTGFFVIDLSRNFGHQIALSAGIDFADADFVAIIDGDLQDPPELIIEMIALSKKGYDIVYGKRSQRPGETFFKKLTAYIFYRLLTKMCQIEIPADTGDFRLMNRKVLLEFKKLKERHRFIRGMIPWLGFRSKEIFYKRDVRYAGKTKFSLKKMTRFALDAVFSFSSLPLSVATYVGLLMVCMGVFLTLYMLYLKLIIQSPAPGVTAILSTILILGGFQILMLGLIGEYIGRIFEEIKGRPLYVINEIFYQKNEHAPEIKSGID